MRTYTVFYTNVVELIQSQIEEDSTSIDTMMCPLDDRRVFE